MAIEKLEDGTEIIHRQDGKKEYIFQKNKKTLRKHHPEKYTKPSDTINIQTKQQEQEETEKLLKVFRESDRKYAEESRLNAIAEGYPTATQAEKERKIKTIEDKGKYPRHWNARGARIVHEGPTQQDISKSGRELPRKLKRRGREYHERFMDEV